MQSSSQAWCFAALRHARAAARACIYVVQECRAGQAFSARPGECHCAASRLRAIAHAVPTAAPVARAVWHRMLQMLLRAQAWMRHAESRGDRSVGLPRSRRAGGPTSHRSGSVRSHPMRPTISRRGRPPPTVRPGTGPCRRENSLGGRGWTI